MIFLYLLILSMPLTRHPLVSTFVGDFTVIKYVGACCLVYALFYLGVRRSWASYLESKQAKLFILLYLVATYSYLTKPPATLSFEISPFFSFTSFLLLFFVTLTLVDSVTKLRTTLLVIVGSAAFASLYVIRDVQKVGFLSGYRPLAWVVGDPNYFSLSALLALPIAYYLYFERPVRWQRLFCLSCLVITVSAMILGASRGGFLGLAAGVLFIAAHTRHRVKTLAAAAAVIVPLCLLSPMSPLSRLLSPGRSDDYSTEARLITWRAGWLMALDHPLQGVGLGNFKSVLPQYVDPETKAVHIAHNAYIELAAETGFPGFILFTGIIFFTGRTLRFIEKQRRGDQSPPLLRQANLALRAGLVGYGVAVFFVSGQYQRLFWFTVFLSICVSSIGHRLSRHRRFDDAPSQSREELGSSTASRQFPDGSPIPTWSRL